MAVGEMQKPPTARRGYLFRSGVCSTQEKLLPANQSSAKVLGRHLQEEPEITEQSCTVYKGPGDWMDA